MTDQIFISYSKKDRDFAWKLADDLGDAGHKVWIDRSLQVGEDWEQTIEKQLAEADEVIVVLSKNAIASKWVQHEGSIAYGLKKRIYPVLIEELPPEDLPIWMNKFQYHSFINVEYETSFDKLNAVLTPKNPIQDLLDRKQYEFETYQLLFEPKELEIVAAQLSDPNLKLSDANKRLLLYSAVVHGLAQPWMGLGGESSLLWLREVILEDAFPIAVRKGAAASLGAVGDRLVYEQLSQAMDSLSTGNAKKDVLDLMALFLQHAPAEFKSPGKLRWDLFLRLARLRVRDGAGERRYMKRVAMILALVSVIILFGTYIVLGNLLDIAPMTNSIGAMFIFLVLGQVFAFLFAEVLTSLELVTQNQSLGWRFLSLTSAGLIAGAPLFMAINGSGIAWFAGGLIGLVLAIWNTQPKPGHPAILWGLGVGVAIVVDAMILSNTTSVFIERVTAAVITPGYVIAYLLFRNKSKV